jgi:flavorubredoxin
MSESPIPIIERQLYALGSTVALDGRISWFPKDEEGFAPISSYLLLNGDYALLIDAGVPAHRDVILEQLDQLLGPKIRLSILHTRVAEYDSAGNTAAIMQRFPVERVYSHFPASIMVGFQTHFGNLAQSDGSAPVNDPVGDGVDWIGGADCTVAKIGDVIPVGEGREVLLLGAPVRILLTFWVYDQATRTLFTSDSFGHVPLPTVSSPRIRDAAHDTTDFEAVQKRLFSKFDWLLDADRTQIIGELASIFEDREIETIAPTHGCVLIGKELVAGHYELVQRALREGMATKDVGRAEQAVGAKVT